MNSMAAAPPIVGGIPVQVPQLPQISMEVAAQAVIPKFYHSVLRFRFWVTMNWRSVWSIPAPMITFAGRGRAENVLIGEIGLAGEH